MPSLKNSRGEVKFDAPCPNCKAQLRRGINELNELLLCCDECDECFGIWDKRLKLSKK